KARSLNYPDEKNSVFTFTIQPPFYRSLLAYVIYVLLLIAVVIGNVIFIQRRVTLTKLQEKEKHSKALREQELSFREQALMAEKEIINLRNESLQSQVIHKNKELANTTLHLIHKNKILNAIKSQLNTLADSTLSQTKKGQIDGIINKINRELKNEKFQQAFDEYFDDVHQDFITRLKDRHPELTPRELRLCAYLKMNLSTKEIAPLMNISVRGVEIGRYRLRKKLELERDDNLIDYLLKL
ncbi:MAG TPA: LuxR C-terminal-related transcriptional regulator, partial [Bacteroidales bacterium]|nr:LuxR C-terminal-related transcriptional regulator [Bacteroidales bacterium]